MHGPGQVAVYPIVPLDGSAGQSAIICAAFRPAWRRCWPTWALPAPACGNLDGIWGRTGQLVAIGAAVKSWVTYHGAFVNVTPAMYLQRLVAADIAHQAPLSSLVIERQQAVKMTRVRSSLVARLAEALGARASIYIPGIPLLAQTSRLPHGSARRAV